jgi:peptide/nickel transport system substrate-binding protein
VQRVLTSAAAASAAALAVAACSSGASSTGSAASSSSASSASAQHYVSGQTATILLPSDPGSLDPDLTSLSVTLQGDHFLYDSLVNFTSSGAMEAGLATKWSGTTTSATFTIRKGVTCSDGSPLTATTVAANINFIGNIKNASSRAGIWVEPGATATADNATGTVTVKSPVPDAFLVSDVGQTQIVCDSGLKNRKLLQEGAEGTGLYTLTSTVPGSSYTLTLRKGYDWGPGGVTSATKGLPATVVLKVVTNMTTGANLLLSGGANIGQVVGADTQRLTSLYSQSVDAPFGVLWFNQKQGTPTAQEPVRKALTQALQLTQLGQVLTGDTGTPATGMVPPALSPCRGNTVGDNLPTYDLSAAKSALAGKNLSIAVYYPTSAGSAAAAAAELMQSTWSQLGVKVSLHGITDAELDTEIVAGQAAWNVAIVPIGLTSPSELVPFVSGATPPAGTDFSYIDNAAYTAAVTKASSAEGSAGCPEWNTAESALYKDVDLVPFVDSATATYAKGATFSLSQGSIAPASIRMLG